MAKRETNPILEKNKGLFIALLANFAIFGVTVTIFGATVPKIIRVFGWSYLVTGAILSGSALGYFISSFISGFLVHRYGPRVVLLTGLLLQALGLAAFGAVGNAIVNLGAVLCLGFGQGATEVVTNVCVARMERPGQSRLMSLMHAAFPVGAIMGPLVVGWLIASSFSWKLMYRAMALLSLVMAGVLSTFEFEGLRTEDEKTHQSHRVSALIRCPLLVFLCITIFLYVGSEIGVSSWVAEYFVKFFEVGVSEGAYMVSVFWAGIMTGRLLVSYAYRGYRQAELLVGLCGRDRYRHCGSGILGCLPSDNGDCRRLLQEGTEYSDRNGVDSGGYRVFLLPIRHGSDCERVWNSYRLSVLPCDYVVNVGFGGCGSVLGEESKRLGFGLTQTCAALSQKILK